MISDPLRGVSDATVVLCSAWFLGGWVLGFLAALVIWWRPIRHCAYDHREATIYKRALEDVEARERVLKAQNTDLARKLVAGHTPRTSRRGPA